MNKSVKIFFGGVFFTGLAIFLVLLLSLGMDKLKMYRSVNFDSLEKDIDEILEETEGKWSVYVEDPYSDDYENLYINEQQMRSYGLINMYIAGAAYEHYDELAAKTKNPDDRILVAMVDGQVADKLISLLGNGDVFSGFQVINDFCVKHNYSDTRINRRVLVEDTPDHNYTSPKDCGKFLRDVLEGNLSHSEELLEILEDSGNRSKIAMGIPRRVRVVNRTGELTTVQNDCAIVYGDKPYIICVMVQDISDVHGTMDTIRDISAEVYRSVN